MKTAMILLLGLLHFVGAACATTRSSLKALFGEPVDGNYVVRPGLNIHVTLLGDDHEPCLLTISGPVSERELMHTFELVVPKEARGLKVGQGSDCVGACMYEIQFERVDFRSGVRDGSQSSEPDALIAFKRKACPASKNAVHEFQFSLQRTLPSP